VRLDPDDVEAIAQRVAELLGAGAEAPVRYVDATHLARLLGVERAWVYAHAAQLGGVRLGGPRGRLRFDLEHVRRVLAGGGSEPVPAPPRARRRRGRCELDRRAEKS
jgi:plasmid replication initiation protein